STVRRGSGFSGESGMGISRPAGAAVGKRFFPARGAPESHDRQGWTHYSRPDLPVNGEGVLLCCPVPLPELLAAEAALTGRAIASSGVVRDHQRSGTLRACYHQPTARWRLSRVGNRRRGRWRPQGQGRIAVAANGARTLVSPSNGPDVCGNPPY